MVMQVLYSKENYATVIEQMVQQHKEWQIKLLNHDGYETITVVIIRL